MLISYVTVKNQIVIFVITFSVFSAFLVVVHASPRLVDPYRRVADQFSLANHCAVIGFDGMIINCWLFIVNN